MIILCVYVKFSSNIITVPSFGNLLEEDISQESDVVLLLGYQRYCKTLHDFACIICILYIRFNNY
jgi:hypothetical protein